MRFKENPNSVGSCPVCEVGKLQKAGEGLLSQIPVVFYAWRAKVQTPQCIGFYGPTRLSNSYNGLKQKLPILSNDVTFFHCCTHLTFYCRHFSIL